MSRRSLHLIIVAVVLGVVLIDQVTKSIAVQQLTGRAPLSFGPVGLSITSNSGAAFSLLSGRSWLFTVLAAVAIPVLLIVAWRSDRPLQAVALALIAGGAAGNLFDRLLRSGHRVVDFITLVHWPTFNVADLCVTVGAVLLVLSTLGPRRAHG